MTSIRRGAVRASAIVAIGNDDRGPHAIVRLSENQDQRVLLDITDLDWFLDFPIGWVISRRKLGDYVRVRGGGKYLHQFLIPGAPMVDHRSGGTLDNRRHNIRPATATQNSANRGRCHNQKSRFIGVHRHTQTQQWTSQIKAAGKRWTIGLFDKEEECAAARDAVAHLVYGEFTRLNFPNRIEQSRLLASRKLREIAEAMTGAGR